MGPLTGPFQAQRKMVALLASCPRHLSLKGPRQGARA